MSVVTRLIALGDFVYQSLWNANRNDMELTKKIARSGRQEADFGSGKGTGMICYHGRRCRLAGIAIEPARDVDCQSPRGL